MSTEVSNQVANPYGLAALWQQGDMVTKTVAIMLLVLSILSWTVMVVRVWHLYRVRRAARAANNFWHTHSFNEGIKVLNAAGNQNAFHHVALEGQAAVAHHTNNKEDLHGQISLTEWLSESLRDAIDDSAQRMQSGVAILASVGSTAPFIGLFGTVWGIYHALVGIGISGQASIDKVAGPVGESLIMTAFGLAVAIPAVLGYNTIQRMNKGVLNKLNRFARQLHAYFLTGSPGNKSNASNAFIVAAQTNE